MYLVYILKSILSETCNMRRARIVTRDGFHSTGGGGANMRRLFLGPTKNKNKNQNRELSGDNSTIVRVKYQLDDIPGNEIGNDEDLRNTTLNTVYDE